MSLIEPTAAPRIALFWGREDLLGKAIELTLANASEWRLIKIPDDQDLQALDREAERLRPEIIFMSLKHCDGLPVQLHSMENNPKLRIIIINPCNNRIEVYSRKVILIHDMSDLLSIINTTSSDTLEGGNSTT